MFLRWCLAQRAPESVVSRVNVLETLESQSRLRVAACSCWAPWCSEVTPAHEPSYKAIVFEESATSPVLSLSSPSVSLMLEPTTSRLLSKCYASTNSCWSVYLSEVICCKWSKPAGFSSISERQPNKLQPLTFFALVIGSWSLASFSPTQLRALNVSHKHTKGLLQSLPTRQLKGKRLDLGLFHSLRPAFFEFPLTRAFTQVTAFLQSADYILA